MKIMELFNAPKADVVGDVAAGAKEIGKGISDFVAGASGGEVDIKNTWNKYINTPKGTTRSINANLPPQEQLDRALNAIYGKNNVTKQLKQDWVDAINSGDKGSVKRLGSREDYRKLRRIEALDGENLKRSHSTVINDLIGMAQGGFEFSANGTSDKQHPDQKQNQDEKL